MDNHLTLNAEIDNKIKLFLYYNALLDNSIQIYTLR